MAADTSPAGRMREVRCAGCGRLLGYTDVVRVGSIQCTDPFCAAAPAVSSNEERDAMMEHLEVVEGYTSERIAKVFNVSRQRVSKVLSDREATCLPRYEPWESA